MFSKIFQFYKKQKALYLKCKAQNRIHNILLDNGMVDSGYVCISIVTQAMIDEDPFDNPRHLVKVSLNDSCPLLDVSAKLDDFRRETIRRFRKQDFISDVIPGDESMFYVARPVSGSWQDKHLVVMECLSWLPLNDGFLPERVMRRIAREFPQIQRECALQ